MTNIKLTQINNNKILVCIIEYGTINKIEDILKELNIEYFTINPYDNPKIKPTHIILSGGPDHVYEINHRPLPKWVIDTDSKVLGICYGMQLIAHTFGKMEGVSLPSTGCVASGAIVSRMEEKEEGLFYVCEYIPKSDNNDTKIIKRWFNRFDNVYKVPDNFTILGYSEKNLIISITDNIKYWGVQYHPEVNKAKDITIFTHFLYIF
jgi:GMP synthase (glutamine-hydrolysing)